MPVSIGVTTQVISQAKWYKHVGQFGLGTIEINRQNSKLHFNHHALLKVKGYLEGYGLSLHSGTAGMFQPNDAFTRANLAVLAAEIEVCRFLGARQLVFHLGDGFLSAVEKSRLGDIIAHAESLGVEMLYESNSALTADYAYDVLGSFPTLGYVLDLGHLNNGHGLGRLGCPMEEFVGRVGSRVSYAHASNNSGLRDEHVGLDRGTLDWRGVLDLLDMSRISKIIIEVRHAGMVEESAAALRQYLVGRPGLAARGAGRPSPPQAAPGLGLPRGARRTRARPQGLRDAMRGPALPAPRRLVAPGGHRQAPPARHGLHPAAPEPAS